MVVSARPKLPRRARVRVCSPSRSIGVKHYGTLEAGRSRVRGVGIETEIGQGELAHVDRFSSAPPAQRANELTKALSDDAIDGVLCSVGGWNAIEILATLDWARLAETRPKPHSLAFPTMPSLQRRSSPNSGGRRTTVPIWARSVTTTTPTTALTTSVRP